MPLTAWRSLGPLTAASPVPAWAVGLLHGLEWMLIAYTGYATVLVLIGFLRAPRGRCALPRNRFAIVIPAHNEQVVVGNLVDSCLALDYPRRLFDVYVIADNCTDGTAATARAHHARVIERRSARRRGKGHALADAFRRLLASRAGYDAVVVFDADNLVDPAFLRVANTALLAGHQVIQGRLDVKNPDDTWVAATFGMCFWVSNRFWFLAKERVGLSAALGGTGMCISTSALRRIGWEPATLTEDLEFSAKALVLGYRTHWAHDAIVYDEKPLSFAQSWRQRLRWAQGQTQVIVRYLPRLIAAGLREGSLTRLEGALALVQPIYVMLSSLLLVVSPLLVRFGHVRLDTLGVGFWVALAVGNYLLPVAAVAYDGAPRRSLRFLLLYPLFLASSVPLTWGGVMSARNHEWSHTVHTRALAYGDLAAGGRGVG